MSHVAASVGSTASTQSRALELTRTIAYWAFTLIVSAEMVAGSLWDLLRIEWVRVVMTDLGYPHYVLSILGVWKLPCAVTLLVPRFQRLKEWAYAGAFFNFTGAAASHYFVGDGKWIGPLVFAGFVLASWALRPPQRRLPSPTAATKERPIAWIVPIAIVGGLVVLALLTLPQGPPPP